MAPIKRIGNIAFQPSTYFGEPPKNISYDIVYYEQNPLYGKDKTNEFYVDGFGWYKSIDKNNRVLYDKSCFQSEETCFTLATFEYDYNEPCWDLRSIGSRPDGLKDEEIKDFWTIMKYGFKYLSNIYYEKQNK